MQQPYMEFKHDGWWIVERDGHFVHGPFFFYEDADQELRWAKAVQDGYLSEAGRERVRERWRNEREARALADAMPEQQLPLTRYWALLALALAVWIYLITRY
jgi:hypothetical protein